MKSNTIHIAAALLIATAIGVGPAALAQVPKPGMTMPGGMAMPGRQAMSVSHQEMMAAMERMNQAMMAPQAMTGDPDRDFVAMMTPHHQGAIDMARLYLREGKDPEIREMAEKIIADQEREIREFQAWQAKHPAPAH